MKLIIVFTSSILFSLLVLRNAVAKPNIDPNIDRIKSEVKAEEFYNNPYSNLDQHIVNGRKAIIEAQYVDAMEYFTNALELSKSYNDSNYTGASYSYISLTYGLVENKSESLKYAILAHSFLERSANKRLQLWSKICLGSAFCINNDKQGAFLLLSSSIEEADSIGFDNQFMIYAYTNLASLCIDKGEYFRAIELLNIAIKYPNTYHTHALIDSYFKLGEAYNKLGDNKKAHQFFQFAHDIAEDEADKTFLAKIYTQKGHFFRSQGDYKLSSFFFTLSDSLWNNVIDSKVRQEVHLVTINQQRENEIKQLEIRRQQAEIEKLNLEKKTVSLTAIVSILLLILSLSWSILIFNKKRRAQKVAKLEQEVSKAKDKALENYIIGQEEERNRLARDLHDGIGSQLAMLKMQLSRNAKECSYGHQSISLCDEIYHELRDVAFNLMPRPLVREGLISATKELCKKLNKSTEIEFGFNSFGPYQRFESYIESALFRITQEITANIVKHSKAQKVQIDFIYDQIGLGLTITWDGKGFDPEKLKKSDGYGWKNINTRLTQLEGTIYLDTSVNHQHNSVLIEIPIKTRGHYGKTG